MIVNKIDINGVMLYPDNREQFWFGGIEGLATPTYRTSSMVYAGRHGGVTPKQRYGQRLVTIPGGIDAYSDTDHLDARGALLEAIPIDVSVPVKFHLGDGRVLLMYAKFEMPTLPISDNLFTDFQLIAIADDYRLFDASSGNVNSITVEKLVTGGLRWQSGGDGSGLRWLSASGLRWLAGAGPMNAVNGGTAPSDSIITIPGANINPILINTTTNEQIKVNVSTGPTDVIEIDTLLKSTKLNGGNINALVEPGSTYFKLEPGDNLLQFTNGNSSGGYAEVEWYNAVLGV